MEDKHFVTVEQESFAATLKELAEMRDQVTRCQKANTELVMENRRLSATLSRYTTCMADVYKRLGEAVIQDICLKTPS
jgi:regulator of replication initiation timing